MHHEVAIYTASSSTGGLYDRSLGRAGGAEIQMTLLARALADRGHRVAHVIYPPREPVELADPLTLVERGPYGGGTPIVGPLLEARRLWQALHEADAEVVIVRTASPALGVAALFCRRARRRLIFSSSNVSDFDPGKMPNRANRRLYRLGVKLVDAVVVQSAEQAALARAAFPSVREVVRIPSFAQPPPDGNEGRPPVAPGAFLWIGRLVPEKRPFEYVRLAQALPEATFRMVAVPREGANEDLADLHAAASEAPNLELVAPLPREELGNLIASSVAVVSTSTLEGMPNVFLEAWSRGVPVLTLDFDPDGIVDARELGISARGSWDRFVAGARELWRRREELDETAERVRAYVEETHSVRAVVALWEELIGAISAPKAGRGPDRD